METNILIMIWIITTFIEITKKSEIQNINYTIVSIIVWIVACFLFGFFIFDYEIKQVILLSTLSIIGSNWLYDQIKSIVPWILEFAKKDDWKDI